MRMLISDERMRASHVGRGGGLALCLHAAWLPKCPLRYPRPSPARFGLADAISPLLTLEWAHLATFFSPFHATYAYLNPYTVRLDTRAADDLPLFLGMAMDHEG